MPVSCLVIIRILGYILSDLLLFIFCLQRCMRFRGLGLQQGTETCGQNFHLPEFSTSLLYSPSLDLALYLINVLMLNFIQYFCVSRTERDS